MADSNTTIRTTEELVVPVEFTSPDGTVSSGTEHFNVMPSLSETFIIGLPSILKQWLSLFMSMLQEEKIVEEFDSLAEMRELIDPWFIPIEEAPEDDEIPDPCAFRYALHYMEMSHEDALVEYYALFETHIDPAFAKAFPVFNLLREYPVVFVPTNWNGINGVEDIEICWHT